MEKTLLSTKRLSINQKELLLHAGFRLVEYDAVTVTLLDFEMPTDLRNAIFTSQNAVKSWLKNRRQLEENPKINCFCVGIKTKALLEENGLNVVKNAQNSIELGHYLVKIEKNEPFYFFCGNRRREELPKMLKSAKIELFEVKTYKTDLNPKGFDQKWDGILFFSPSGVASFVQANSLESSPAFCIGETTAAEAKKYTPEVVIANSTTVESVIAKAAKTLNVTYDRN